MRTHLNRAIVFAVYQLTLITGILLLPLALAMRKAGITLPIHRAVSRVNDVYDETTSPAA